MPNLPLSQAQGHIKHKEPSPAWHFGNQMGLVGRGGGQLLVPGAEQSILAGLNRAAWDRRGNRTHCATHFSSTQNDHLAF